METSVLRYVDILIGLAFVMLLGCSVVTAVTQIATSGFYLRAQYLRQGLADLLQQLDPEAAAMDCQYMARLIQRHPMIGRPSTKLLGGEMGTAIERKLSSKWLPSDAPGAVIQRHELLRILLEWGAGMGAFGTRPDLAQYTARLRAALTRAGITNPGDTLASLQYHTVLQERAAPQLAAHFWHTAASIDSCPATMIDRFHTWFDSMSARTSQRFSLQTRWITTAVSLAVVLALPLDALQLIQRLSQDTKFREYLVTQAEEKVSSSTTPAEQKNALQEAKENAAVLNLTGVTTTDNRFDSSHYPGYLLAIVLLSLGTPFWYDVLKNTLRFRSVLAQKEEQDRTERQRSDPDVAKETAASVAGIPAGTVSVAASPVSGAVS